MRVLVGITGGIAAYKAAEIVREFTELGNDVRVVATPNALRFIGAATLEALSHNSVSSELYSDIPEVKHVEMAQWADVILVAPATASFLARTVAGLADDLLGNILLAAIAPIVIAPAMHTEMWLNSATVANISTLRSRGYTVIDPAVGRLTGVDTGVGRLPETSQLVEATLATLEFQDLAGKNVLVVAGGTREYIDPVRYLGNKSSGKQGIALVTEAKARGAKVTLIAANFDFSASDVVTYRVETTAELISTIDGLSTAFDFVIMPAAVSDFRSEVLSTTKLKKNDSSRMSLELIQNPDVIAEISKVGKARNNSLKVVGFAAETATGIELTQLAKSKLDKKGLDLIVANDVSNGAAFDSDTNSVLILGASISEEVNGSKREIAGAIFDQLLKLP